MLNKVVICLLLPLMFAIQADKCDKVKDKNMNDQPLEVRVFCRDNERCLFDGEDIVIDIRITNNHNAAIRFPLEYTKKKSPVIELRDNRTKTTTFLPTHIADHELKENLETVAPGESVYVEWIIMADELTQFDDDVDVSAKVTIMADIDVGGKKVSWKGSDIIRIVSKKRGPENS